MGNLATLLTDQLYSGQLFLMSLRHISGSEEQSMEGSSWGTHETLGEPSGETSYARQRVRRSCGGGTLQRLATKPSISMAVLAPPQRVHERYIYIYTYVNIYIYIYTLLCIYICVYMYDCEHIYMYLSGSRDPRLGDGSGLFHAGCCWVTWLFL